MRLTNQTITKLSVPHGQREIIFFDDDVPGFGLRIREGGSRTWCFQYKLASQQRRISFGTVSAMPAPKARARAELLHAKVKLGQDPAGEKIEATARAADVFEPLAEEFLTYQKTRPRKNGSVGLKPRSYVEIERHLLTHAKPLHRLAVRAIDQSRISELLDDITKNSGPVTANRVRSTFSTFFMWCMRRGRAVANPVMLTEKHEEHERDRVLTAVELRLIWNALPKGDYGDILRLLMLTGQRRDEIGSVRWSEIEEDNKAILWPKERTKNGRPHRVPLSAPARAILGARPLRADRDLIFGEGEGGFSGWSSCKKRLDKALLQACKEAKLKPIPHWTPHDFRRSADTMMNEELGILPHVVEAVLNHVSGDRSGKSGVSGVYNKATYENEKANALARWAEHLMAIVEKRESNVTPLKRA